MTSIDTSEWREFVVGDLFEGVTKTRKGKTFTKSKVANFPNTLPALSSTVSNNSLGFFVNPEEHNSLSNCLSMTSNGNAGHTAYHADPFAIVQDAYALILKNEEWRDNRFVLLFLSSIFNQTTEKRYNWGNKATWTLVQKDKIPLPSTPSGEPDWEYMESYMREVSQEAEDTLEVLGGGYEEPEVIDISEWVEFKVGDLFDYGHGSRLNVADRVPGDLAFVTAGKLNNGVSTYISNDVEKFNNPITVDMFGNCAVQPGECSGDDNVYFYTNNDVSNAAKLYVASIVRQIVSQIFTYNSQFRKGDAQTLTIPLPATPSGEPDWVYMENYMRDIMGEGNSDGGAQKTPPGWHLTR